MAGEPLIKLPFYKYDDKKDHLRVLLIMDGFKTKMFGGKPADGITVTEPTYTESSVGLKVVIEKPKKGEKTIYQFNLKLPEEIIPGECKWKILGDEKVELRLQKYKKVSWETYFNDMTPTTDDL